jgi:hypothetical protein
MCVALCCKLALSLNRFKGASVPAAPTLAAAESEAAEAAAAPPIAEAELTAEQEDLLASFLSEVTQVPVPCAHPFAPQFRLPLTPHQEQQRLALERVFLQNLDPFRVLDVEPTATEEELQVSCSVGALKPRSFLPCDHFLKAIFKLQPSGRVSQAVVAHSPRQKL